jgi:hypothetical protein
MRLYIGGTEVLLSPDELPEFTYSLIEIIDPSKTRGSTSTTFDIPNTNATRIALGGPAMSETVAGEQSIRIGDGGQVLFEGVCTPVEWSEDRVSIAAFGDNADWIGKAKNTKCVEVDLGVSEFVANAMQEASWVDDNRADVYPLIDYGALRDHTSTTNVIEEDLYPAVRVWRLLSAFFTNLGFSIVPSGAFAGIWKKLIIPYNGGAIVAGGGIAAEYSPSVSLATDRVVVNSLPFDTLVSDTYLMMGVTAGIYDRFTPSVYATWSIMLDATFTVVRGPDAPSASTRMVFALQQLTGVSFWTTIETRYFPLVGNQFTFSGELFNILLEDTETYRIIVNTFADFGADDTVTMVEGSTMRINLVQYEGWQAGIKFDIGKSMDGALKVGDVISSLSNILRLAIRTDQTTNTVTVGYLEDYLEDISNGIDWQDRVDYSSPPSKVQPEVPANYRFKYSEDDKDQKLIDYKDARGVYLGEGSYATGGRDDDSEITVKFAPTQEGPRFGGLTIPVLEDERTPLVNYVEHKVRLLVFDGLRTGAWRFDGVARTQFPRAYFLGSGAGDTCLSFGSDWRQGTIDTFWRSFIIRSTRPYFKGLVRLYDDEFMNFKFGKPRLVRDAYGPFWVYVQKISGKTFGDDSPVECELIPV